MKYHIFLGLMAVAAASAGVIHDEGPQLQEKYDHALIGESEHHHHVQHEHAKSHQSIKFEHFHPVPVYVKKEHSHLLKHPLEKGKSEQELKQIHPEVEHAHGHGLVLEDHRYNTEHHAAEPSHYEHFGGFEGSEGLHAFAGSDYQLHQPALQEEAQHYQFQPEQEAHEGYKYDGY